MTCRDVERMILERGAAETGPEERLAIEAHLKVCAECRSFATSLLGIREGIEELGQESLPDPLDRRTKEMALAVLRGNEAETRRSLPVRITVALAALTVLTIVWVTASFAGLGPEQTFRDLPLAARVAILFIAQNGFVLFFAPVILRATRPGPNGNHGFPS